MLKGLFNDNGFRFCVFLNNTPEDIQWVEKTLRCRFVKWLAD